VLERSVFDRIPGAGRWRTALLLDGNLGIGADPRSLLRRVFALVQKGAEVLVEVTEPGTVGTSGLARLEIDGVAGPRFAWSPVSVDELAPIAAGAHGRVLDTWCDGARWFAALRHG
jgi:hypothetical protein